MTFSPRRGVAFLRRLKAAVSCHISMSKRYTNLIEENRRLREENARLKKENEELSFDIRVDYLMGQKDNYWMTREEAEELVRHGQ